MTMAFLSTTDKRKETGKVEKYTQQLLISYLPPLFCYVLLIDRYNGSETGRVSGRV